MRRNAHFFEKKKKKFTHINNLLVCTDKFIMVICVFLNMCIQIHVYENGFHRKNSKNKSIIMKNEKQSISDSTIN